MKVEVEEFDRKIGHRWLNAGREINYRNFADSHWGEFKLFLEFQHSRKNLISENTAKHGARKVYQLFREIH